MDKQSFLNQLESGLKKHHVHDVKDIIAEYQYHFDYQIEQGKKESDIAKSLGDINSIISDYAQIGSKTRSKWFDLVTVGFIAVPLLIILYGVFIIFITTAISFWGVAIYYLLNLSSLSFMPNLPFGVHFLYILTSLSMTFLFIILSIYLFKHIKSMTQQFIVKQKIRIGHYHIKPIVRKLLIYSLIFMPILMLITYIISAVVAKNYEFWHTWHWFSE